MKYLHAVVSVNRHMEIREVLHLRNSYTFLFQLLKAIASVMLQYIKAQPIPENSWIS